MTARSASIARSVVLATLVAIAIAACDDDSGTPIDGAADVTSAAAATPTTAASALDTSSGSTSGTSPDTSTGSASDTSQGSGQQPEGFTTIQAQITEADGDVCEVCLWLADDATERGRGLMGVTDLGDAVGMAFRFDEATTGSFYMFQTPTPLSIAWFAPDGAHVDSVDMAPCIDTSAGECPLYAPGGPYDLAIEVFEGGLTPLGLGPGSSVELIEGSEAESCPAAR